MFFTIGRLDNHVSAGGIWFLFMIVVGGVSRLWVFVSAANWLQIHELW